MVCACIKGWTATRLTRKLVLRHLRQPALSITVGKVIATAWSNFQSPLDQQFAMYRLKKTPLRTALPVPVRVTRIVTLPVIHHAKYSLEYAHFAVPVGF